MKMSDFNRIGLIYTLNNNSIKEKEKETKKEITKDEFVKILLENNFKEFPINTKKKNNILKKILVTKE